MSTSQVIIVLPGTTGSTLTGTVFGTTVTVWPDVVAPLSITDPAGAANIMKDKSSYGALSVGSIAGWNKQQGVYYTLLTSLADKAQATAYCANPNESDWGLPTSKPSGNMVVAFPYDWRKDNVTNASSLQSLLSTINTLYASDVSISLVAHSMGGILSRVYLETVGRNDAWYSKIHCLITLGTPHLGAPLALQAINGTLNMATYVGEIEVDGVPIPPGGFDNMIWNFVDSDYGNSTFELLPPPMIANSDMPAAVQFLMDQSGSTPAAYSLLSGTGLNANLPTYVTSALQGDVNTKDSWSEVNAAFSSAAPVLSALAGTAYGKPPTNPPLPPYYCIYGLSCMYPTSMAMIYTGTSSEWIGSPWFSVDAVQGGDQIVPMSSAVFQGGPVAAAYRALSAPTPVDANTETTPPGSVNHLQLPASPDAIEQIATWLGLGN